jgi:PAS domain S-box-containing protein
VGRDLSEIKKTLIELKASNERLSREIIERKRAEEDVRRLNRQNQLILDAAGEGIAGFDLKGRVTFINPAGAELAGYQVEELIQKDFHQVVHHSKPDGTPYPVHECPMFESLSTGVARRERDEVFWRKDGSSFPVAYSSTPILEEGQIVGAVLTFLDITLRKLALEELNKYRDHLEDLVRERTAELAITNERLTREIEERKRAEQGLKGTSEKFKFFAYSVAHDLKSPAIGVYGLTKRLSKHTRDVLDEKGRTYCKQILKLSEHIAALVEKINIYIATKEATPLIETTNVAEILRMLKDEFSAQLSLRRIEWFAPESEVKIEADRLSILRIFRNLIDNALKYGGESLTRISIGYEDSESRHIFSVSDNGKGLKEADSKKIFGLFQRDETSRGVEGAGLGLAIVKEIAEQHGGRVWVEPRGKKGTTFCVSISKNL